MGYVGIGALPQVYRSKAEIIVTMDSVPDSLLDRSFLGFSDENASRLFVHYKTREFIQATLESFEGLADMMEHGDGEDMDGLVDRIISGLKLEFLYDEVDMPGYYVPIRVVRAFYLTADSDNPLLSSFMVNRLAQAIVDDNDLMQRNAAQSAINFLVGEQEKLSKRLRELQHDILTLQSQHYAELPLDERSKRESLSKLDRSVENLKVGIAARESLLRKIDVQITQLGSARIDTGDGSLDTLVSKLDDAKRDLNILGSVYNGDYPDLQQSLQIVVDLRAKLENLAPGASNYSIAKLSYLDDLKVERDALNAHLKELRVQLDGLDSYSRQLKENLRGGVPVERQYRSLLLEEIGISEQLRVLKKKEFTAQTMLRLSKNQLLGGFTIKKRGQPSPDPLYPNVLACMTLIAYLALISSTILTLNGVGQTEEIRNSSDLKLTAGDAVLGVIPRIPNL